ncbi:MAG: TRAP transporter large permease subunit [Rhodopseudomonas sp.]|nr:TRAP transporter large permease subunit [Rhodopseudomonas sp.]
MTALWVGIIGLAAMLALIALGIPIALSLLATGAVGLIVMGGSVFAETQLVLNLWDEGTNFALTAIPLYLLMGQLVFRTGLATDLYDCIYKWVGRMPGGLAIASVIASAGFGAVSGGSASSVVTLGPMCMPEMRKFKYDGGLAAGSIASAGTLGILIPPSIFMVAYGLWTETSIGALFIAGIVPGIIMTLAFSALVYIRCRLNPALGPVGASFPFAEKLRSLLRLLPILVIFGIIIGGIYGGIFDPTEAAAIGVVGVLAVAGIMGRLSLSALKEALWGTSRTSVMIFMILLGGHVVSRFLVLTEITSKIVQLITDMQLSSVGLIFCFTVMYIVLGMILDIWAMLILTVPFVFPVIVAHHIDAVWFGVYLIIMCELAAITPPIGLNVYIMARVAPEIPVGRIFRGVMPFFLTALAVLALLVAVPDLVTWLPGHALSK